MKRFRAYRSKLIAVAIVMLGVVAIFVIGGVQERADRSRSAQVRIGHIQLVLLGLKEEPYLVASEYGGQVTEAQAAAAMKRQRGQIATDLAALRQYGDPPPALLAAERSLRAINALLDQMLPLQARGLGRGPAADAITAQLLKVDSSNKIELHEASAQYASRAVVAQRNAWIGLVTTVVLLLGVFLFFFRRSVREQHTIAALLDDNERLLRASRAEALTDPLTGLHNRRALVIDLKQELASASADDEVLLALFDLDGFKIYNDTFGHAAGDGLLHRLATNLAATAGSSGKAYRLGGDEFCVMTRSGRLEARDLIARSVDALTDGGQGWQIGASVGTVWVPADARDAEHALVLADERMYSDKAHRKAGRPTSKASFALPEGDGAETSAGPVEDMAMRTARMLSLSVEDVAAVAHAAAQHDIGKAAIPDSILAKQGELNASEWALLRQHSVTGGRLVFAAEAREQTALVVRASHERYDGGGYPDGLAGEQIPLGARIIAVCDAFHAMTSERPFRVAMTEAEALAEIHSCAGAQFDPDVVAAFTRSLADGAPAPGVRAETEPH